MLRLVYEIITALSDIYIQERPLTRELEYPAVASILLLFVHGGWAAFGVFLLWICVLRICDYYWISRPTICFGSNSFAGGFSIEFVCRGYVHRDGKPAMIGRTKVYKIFGAEHRIGGPAARRYNGGFFLFGAEYSPKEYAAATEGTELEIALRVYASPKVRLSSRYILPTDIERQRGLIEKFLKMRGQEQLIKNFRAAIALK